MCIRRNLLNLRVLRKRTGILGIIIVFCLLVVINFLVVVGNEVGARGSLDSLSTTKDSTNVKPEAAAATNNNSTVKIENGVPKLSVNGKIINNMFGIHVYCTGVDPRTNQFLVDMKEVIDRTSNLDIPIMGFDILWADYDRSTSLPRDAQEAANRFYTKNLDELLNYAASKKVYVVFRLLVHSHWGLPLWWKDYKDNKNGYQLIDGASNASSDYNRLQSPVASYQSITHRELLKALLDRLVMRYKNHPAIVGWGINVGPTGENGYAPNYIEMIMNPQMPQIDFRIAMADYSVMAKNSFTLWLERKYGNIKQLNASWNTLFDAFDQVMPPGPRKFTLNETFNFNGDSRTSMKDWQQFRYEAIMDEWSYLTALVRNRDPGKIIMGTTTWYPTEKSTGTSNMLISAVAVNEKQLINVNMVASGITEKDYLRNTVSRIDYADFSKFNRKYGTVSVCSLENWIKSPGHKIEIDPSIAVKNAIRNAGSYLWFVVALKHDQMSKPCWSWKEIAELVKRSNHNELKPVIIKDPPILFYVDVGNPMSNYFEPQEDLGIPKLYRGITRILFDNNPELNYGFISSSHLTDALSSGKTRLLIMANQRYLANEMAEQLRKYVSKGGTILLVGSNGVFDDSFKKHAHSIRTLALQLSDRQLQALYDWGLQDEIRVPFIVVSANGSSFIEIPLKGDPAANYRQLRAALPITLGLSENGQLFLSSLHYPIHPHEMLMPKGLDVPRGSGQIQPAGSPPSPRREKNFMRDFDVNRDGVVSAQEFPGPVEVFNHLDINRDGVITKEEAEADGKAPFEEK